MILHGSFLWGLRASKIAPRTDRIWSNQNWEWDVLLNCKRRPILGVLWIKERIKTEHQVKSFANRFRFLEETKAIYEADLAEKKSMCSRIQAAAQQSYTQVERSRPKNGLLRSVRQIRWKFQMGLQEIWYPGSQKTLPELNPRQLNIPMSLTMRRVCQDGNQPTEKNLETRRSGLRKTHTGQYMPKNHSSMPIISGLCIEMPWVMFYDSPESGFSSSLLGVNMQIRFLMAFEEFTNPAETVIQQGSISRINGLFYDD